MADLESQLLAAAMVLKLREASRSPTAAMAYVRELLVEAEKDFATSGKPISSRVKLINPSAPKHKAVAKLRHMGKKVPLKRTSDKGDLSGRIRVAMKDGKEHSTEQVAKALGESRDRVGDAMKRMESRTKDLNRVRPGVYVLKGSSKSKR